MTLPKSVSAIAPRTPRVSLGSVVKAANNRPMRILLHGVEKVGKTTFAAAAPNPIFICPEDGIPSSAGAVAHFPAPGDDGWTWQDVIDAVRVLTTEKHDHKTLVLDTLDWIEPLLWRSVCAGAGAKSIEEVGGGYGKGYTAAVDGWRSLVAALEAMRRANGMHVILLAHSWIRPFKDPESEGYDRYELKINNKAAGLLKEWCDAVLFAKHEDVAAKDSRTKRVRGISTGARQICTVHHAAYDAGNRYDLPETLPLDWEAFAEAVKAGRPADPNALRESIAGYLPQIDPATAAKVKDAVAQAGDDAAALAKINNRLAALAGEGKA